jgi:5-formyltetrahydrofolate cyclo-ligase
MTQDTKASTSNKKALRRHLRRRRRSLKPAQQRQAARALTRQLLLHFGHRRGRHVGLYLPNDGEIDPRYFMHEARRRGFVIYLPKLHPVLGNLLWFYRFDENTPLLENHLGIPEPCAPRRASRPPWALNTVLMPLVGFDLNGARLGMGGGFYDRTFAFKRLMPARPPALIGMAHDVQQVDELPVASWDVPMNGIVTPTRRIHTTASAARHHQVGKGLFVGHYRLADSRRGRARH